MKRVRRYVPEFGLIAIVMVVSVLGFWNIFFGAPAEAQPHHYLHLATAFLWLWLLLAQLVLLARQNRVAHRKLGLIVLVVAPVLVATTAMLSVHSAARALAAGEDDFLIVQNVMVTLELGFLICLAFALKHRRQLHGSLLLSTTLLFLGIALFFALTSFYPPLRIEGPETFYRFQLAGMAGQAICIGLGFLFFVRDWRNNWPFLVAGACFLLNQGIRSLLVDAGLIDPLTVLVGGMNEPLTFVATFLLVLALLAAKVLPDTRRAQLARG